MKIIAPIFIVFIYTILMKLCIEKKSYIDSKHKEYIQKKISSSWNIFKIVTGRSNPL